MVVVNYKGKDFYIDGGLKIQLDKKVLPQLQKKDKDVVFIVDGEERAGKSVFAMQLAGYAASYFGTEYNLDNVCLNPVEFKTKIENANKNEVVIYDEAHRGMASARSLSEVNNILKDLMMEMGQRNLFVVIVLPTFFLLDKYAALFRARGLFHIYENRNRRGFWVYFNKKHKLKLYMKGRKEFNYNCMKYPGFRGRFYDQYVIDEEGYREKKGQSFKVRAKITKEDVYSKEVTLLLWILRKECGLNSKQIIDLMKLHGEARFTNLAIRKRWQEYRDSRGIKVKVNTKDSN